MSDLQKSLFIIVFMLLLCGCAEEMPQKDTISIGGSSSGIIILEHVIELFNDKYPEYKIQVLPGTETKDGLIGVSEGLIDIGSQARYLKESEKEQFPNVREVIILQDAMVIGTHPDVGVESLTIDQINKIYSGEIQDWSEVGGATGKIVVLDREESDSSKILLKEKIFYPDLEIVPDAIILHSAGDMNRAIENTPFAIGPSSLGTIKSLNLNINIVAVDGVLPSDTTINNGGYKLLRTYGLSVLKGELDPLTQLFVDFCQSDEAQAALRNKGYFPISAEK